MKQYWPSNAVHVAACLFAAAVSAAGSASQAGEAPQRMKKEEAFRQLATLPMGLVDHRMGLTLGLGFSVEEGFSFYSSAADPERIRACRAQTAGHPRDSGAWYRLGLLLRADERPGQASEALDHAVSVARAEVARNPRDPEAALRLARSLLGAGNRAEAVATLRSVVQLRPKRCGARIALGSAIAGLGSPESGEEARQVFEEAVRRFPHRSEVYAARAGFLFYHGFQEHALTDYRRAGELAPNDPYAMALSPWMEEAASAMRNGQGMALDRSWADLGPSVREAVSKTMGRLRRLSLDDDQVRSAKALTALGFIRYELQHDVQGALADLNGALRRNPGFPDAREMILHIYGVEGQWWDLADFSRACASQTGKIRFRLVAAFALTHLERFEDAASQLDLGLRSQPKDLALLLARASIALKQTSGSGDALANSLLTRAEAVLPAQPRFKAEAAYLRSLYLALNGHPIAARMALSEALESTYARQARKALALLDKP